MFWTTLSSELISAASVLHLISGQAPCLEKVDKYLNLLGIGKCLSVSIRPQGIALNLCWAQKHPQEKGILPNNQKIKFCASWQNKTVHIKGQIYQRGWDGILVKYCHWKSDREQAGCSPTLCPASVLLQVVSCAGEVTDVCTAGSGLTLFTWFSEGIGTLSLIQTQHTLFSSLDWLFLTVIPALVHPWSLWMFLGRVIKGRGVLEVDHLFYSILFRCGIYKSSKTGSERKANILLNWRLPQNRQLQPSLSLFSLPVLSSMTWFEDHLQWDQKVIFPVLWSTSHFTCTPPVSWVASETGMNSGLPYLNHEQLQERQWCSEGEIRSERAYKALEMCSCHGELRHPGKWLVKTLSHQLGIL